MRTCTTKSDSLPLRNTPKLQRPPRPHTKQGPTLTAEELYQEMLRRREYVQREKEQEKANAMKASAAKQVHTYEGRARV